MAAEDSNSNAAGSAPAAAAAAAPAENSNPKNADSQHSGKQHGGQGNRGGHNKKKRGFGARGKDSAYKSINRREMIEYRSAKRRRAEEATREGGEGDDETTREAREAFVASLGPSNMRIPFSAEEIAAEKRKPKRKVAVLIGYAGTGYRGMQINHEEKTIEGDLFRAFVEAGAISKANADDPKKSSLVRCARTDKGVHAAGNIISLKLIVEDDKVAERINAALPDQIRVWGIQRTINSFNCYQACDSRRYEYLLPTYALLPPHPNSFLGREMVAAAKRADEKAGNTEVYDEMMRRLDDAKDFWPELERDVVQPMLAKLDPAIRKRVEDALHSVEDDGIRSLDDIERTKEELDKKNQERAASAEAEARKTPPPAEPAPPVDPEAEAAAKASKLAVDQALREIKAAYVAAKRRYRVAPQRLAYLQEALSQYEGTRNYHNYTVHKSFKDASANRHIKSFAIANDGQPILAGGGGNDGAATTEWISIKVHGQSFMMHQIRKMIAMAVMLTRCGTPPASITALSYGPRRISIPRAPGLGLLLERPVFDSYNDRAAVNFNRDKISFDIYEKEMNEFKDRQIYQRIFDVEAAQTVFHSFFHQLDNYRTSYYLWAVPGGYDTAYERFGRGESGKEPKLPGEVDEAENTDEGSS